MIIELTSWWQVDWIRRHRVILADSPVGHDTRQVQESLSQHACKCATCIQGYCFHFSILMRRNSDIPKFWYKPTRISTEIFQKSPDIDTHVEWKWAHAINEYFANATRALDTLEFSTCECHWIQWIRQIMTKYKNGMVTRDITYLISCRSIILPRRGEGV